LRDRIIAAKEKYGIEGITISGGEPLQQKWPLIHFLQSIRKHTDLSVVLFTGYEGSEIWKMPGSGYLPTLCDAIICGRYKEDQRLASGLRGSANKQILCFGRYKREDFETIPKAEIIISAGAIISTGINPVNLPTW